jgi:alkylated DNA repair dioxygenase AlkB
MPFHALPLPAADLAFDPHFLSPTLAQALLEDLSAAVPWEQRSIRLFGRELAQPRLTAWYGDPGAAYSYSGLHWVPRPWRQQLQTLRRRVEVVTGHRFNSVLLNLYRDGRDSMGWHADDEAELGLTPVIASLSLGATRRFRLRPRPDTAGEAFGLDLPGGSLLLMRPPTQAHWQHALPKTSRSVGPRLNLTFRWVEGQGQ